LAAALGSKLAAIPSEKNRQSLNGGIEAFFGQGQYEDYLDKLLKSTEESPPSPFSYDGWDWRQQVEIEDAQHREWSLEICASFVEEV
jgi:hypothetical protein